MKTFYAVALIVDLSQCCYSQLQSIDKKDYPSYGSTKEDIVKLLGLPKTMTPERLIYFSGGKGVSFLFKADKLTAINFTWIDLNVLKVVETLQQIHKVISMYGQPVIDEDSFHIVGKDESILAIARQNEKKSFSISFGFSSN